MLIKTVNPYDKFIQPVDVESLNIMFIVFIVWAIIFVLQVFLAFGTAYRCTKNGNDNGVGLFIYLLGFIFAAIIPGLGLHYYIKHLPPKIIIKQNVQNVQPQVIRVVDPTQMPQNAVYQQQIPPQNPQNVVYQQQMPPMDAQQSQQQDNNKKK